MDGVYTYTARSPKRLSIVFQPRDNNYMGKLTIYPKGAVSMRFSSLA